MKIEECLKNLKDKRAILMPDFFIDHLLYWEKSLEELVKKMKGVAERKGGNIPVNQALTLGGCAAKTAWVLSLLGLKPVFFTQTSAFGLELLKHFFQEKADLSRVKIDGELALCIAIETSEANIMFNSRGSLVDFDWEIVKENRGLLTKADVVGIFSWNHLKRGTHLAQKVFSETSGLRFLDTGDPTIKSREEAEQLVKNVKLDIWSMNENEARYFCSFFKPTDEPKEAADILFRNGIKAVLHTRDYSYSPDGILSPSFKVEVKRATGAGDCWNAGYIAGKISNLDTEECLTLANAVAACWISGQEITPANISHLLEQREFFK